MQLDVASSLQKLFETIHDDSADPHENAHTRIRPLDALLRFSAGQVKLRCTGPSLVRDHVPLADVLKT
jgi:hypothetical protein